MAVHRSALLQGLLNNHTQPFVLEFVQVTQSGVGNTNVNRGPDAPQGARSQQSIFPAAGSIATARPQWVVPSRTFTPHPTIRSPYRNHCTDMLTFIPESSAPEPTTLPGFDAQVGGPSEVDEGTGPMSSLPSVLNELRVGETRVDFLFGPRLRRLAQSRGKEYST